MKRKACMLLSLLLAAVCLLSGCGEKTPSESVLWINSTYAILTKVNGGDVNQVGGYVKNASSTKLVTQLLEEWWEITDRQSAEKQLDWLLQEGHRQEFLESLHENHLETYTKEELQAALTDYSEEDQIYFNLMYDAYAQFGEHAIDAWDYCRAIQLLGYFYIADYYTYEEALDKSLEIGKSLQTIYDSWEEMAQSYLFGCQYWQGGDPNDPESDLSKRYAILEELKSDADSPYQTLNWGMELTKTW